MDQDRRRSTACHDSCNGDPDTLQGDLQLHLGVNSRYPLVNIQKTMENHHFQWVNPLFLWSFSIAMSNLPEGTSVRLQLGCLFFMCFFHCDFRSPKNQLGSEFYAPAWSDRLQIAPGRHPGCISGNDPRSYHFSFVTGKKTARSCTLAGNPTKIVIEGFSTEIYMAVN